MLTKMRWFLIITLAGLLIFSGCKTEDTTGPEDSGDTLIIKSVIPDSGLAPGILTAFVVIVEYELVSVENGEINIGFNTAEAGRYTLISEAKTLVAKGSGEHQFNVNVVTWDWGAAGDFGVYVNLSENPHGSTWTPLVIVIQVLPFI
jgi:hypothetical protein